MNQGRDHSISAIRCIAMCFIVMCHVMQYYDFGLAWWFNVGVQIFLFISGFLYSGKSIESPIKWIGRQFKKILVPYYTFLIAAFILYVIFVPNISFIDFGGSLFCVSTVDGIGHLWFIQYILFCYLITPYLCYLKLWLENSSMKKALVYLLVIWVVYVIVSIKIYDYLNPIWISCYILGYFYGVYSKKISAKSLTIVNFMSIFGAIAFNVAKVCIRRYAEIPTDGSLVLVFEIFENTSHLLLGFALYIIFHRLFQKVHKSRFLTLSDKYSYEIYIVHQLFILSPFTLMDITPYFYLNWIFVLIAIVASGFLLNKISLFINGRAQ